jgi:hypothetical protein
LDGRQDVVRHVSEEPQRDVRRAWRHPRNPRGYARLFDDALNRLARRRQLRARPIVRIDRDEQTHGYIE